MIKILHLADVHLGAPLANFGDYAGRRRAEQEASFRRAVELALHERVHAVLIAGDLFDSFRPDAGSVNLARAELGRLRAARIPVFGVPGTHDSLGWADCVYRKESLPFYRFFTEPTFGEPATVELGDGTLAVYGIAYDKERSGRGWDSLARRDVEGVHVALVHAARRLAPDLPIGSDDLPFDAVELEGLGMDYVALGHYHNLRLFQKGERVVGAYSGSLEGRDWTETGPRHVLLVEWDSPREGPKVTPVPVQTRTLEEREVEVTGLGEAEAILDALRAACDAGPLWRVTLVGEPEVVIRPRDLEAALAPVYEHLRVRDATTLSRSHLLSERLEEETVRGEFFRRLAKVRAGARDERERVVAERALKIGLRVFG